jgi:hypothetical protein
MIDSKPRPDRMGMWLLGAFLFIAWRGHADMSALCTSADGPLVAAVLTAAVAVQAAVGTVSVSCGFIGCWIRRTSSSAMPCPVGGALL